MKQIRNFINGEFVGTDRWFDKRAPYDGKVIAVVAEAGKAEVDDAVRAARAALHGPWGSGSTCCTPWPPKSNGASRTSSPPR
jgi:aminomuconate-semialdehyde/2-hydroxymuconate-6-semialdehyde dehydrogenase